MKGSAFAGGMVYEPSSPGSAKVIALRSRAKSHHDIFGPQNRVEPRPIEDGKIQGRKRTFSDNYGMHELDRDVLRVRGVGTLTEGEQASATQKTIGHFVAGFREARSFARKKGFEDLVTRQKALFDLRGELVFRGHFSVLVFPRSVSLADARQWITNQHVDDPAAAVKSRDQHGAGGLLAYFTNHTGFFAAGRLLERL